MNFMAFVRDNWTIIMAVLGAVVFVIRFYDRHLKVEASAQAVSKSLQAHLDDCDKLPKSLIAEKLDNFCDRLDDIKATNEAHYIQFGTKLETMREETRHDFGVVHKRIDFLMQSPK